MKLSSDKFFDLLNEEDENLHTEIGISDFEKRLEEGFNKIDQKLNEALQQINQKREEPEERTSAQWQNLLRWRPSRQRSDIIIFTGSARRN